MTRDAQVNCGVFSEMVTPHHLVAMGLAQKDMIIVTIQKLWGIQTWRKWE